MYNMNFINEIKYADLEVNNLGLMVPEKFNEIIDSIVDVGSTYRFIITQNAKVLTKNGIPFNSILFTIRNNELYLNENENLSSKDNYENVLNPENDPEIENIFKIAQIGLANELMLLSLQGSLEEMIIESDYLKEIYLNKGITRKDVWNNKSLLSKLDSISLGYFKSSV